MKYAVIVALWAFAAACSPPQARAQQDSARTQAPADTTKREVESFARHTIYYEFFGNGIIGSINYDFRIAKHLSVRTAVLPILLIINLLGGGGEHLFEVGLGYGYASNKPHLDVGGSSGGSSKPISYTTAALTYRYQPQDSGLFFKIGLTPFWIWREESSIWAGIALGYTF